MSAEKLKTEIRKEQIAEAALTVIASHGVKGLSVARTARRVGIVPSAIYRHFEGKSQILDAVLALIEQRLLDNVGVVRRLETHPMERLNQLLRLHIQFIRENQGVFRVVFSEESYSGSPVRKIQIYNMIRRYLGLVEQIVREGQETGSIRADIPADTVSVMFLGLIQPGAILWNLSEGEFDVTRHAEKAWRIFRESLQPQTAQVKGKER